LQRQKAKEYLSPLFAVVDPMKAGELMKNYRRSVFPEDRFDDLKYYKQAKSVFEKMRGMTLKAFVQ